MVTITNLRGTLMTMAPGDELEIRNEGRSVNSIRNAACLIGKERGLRYRVSVDWASGLSVIKCMEA